MADGVSVFNDVFAFLKVFQCKFVSGKNILIQGDFLSVHREFFTSRKCCDSHCNIVGRIDFQVLCLHLLNSPFTIYNVQFGCAALVLVPFRMPELYIVDGTLYMQLFIVIKLYILLR